MKGQHIGLGVAALAVIGALALWVARGTNGGVAPTPAAELTEAGPVDFPPFILPLDALTPTWDAERAAATEPDAAGAALIDALHRDNYATGVGARGLFEGDASMLRADLDARRRAWTSGRTIEDYRHLSWAAYAPFESALTELLRMAQTTHTPLEELLADPLLTQSHAYYEGCGDFLDAALQYGIVGATGELNVQPEMILIFFRQRWAWSAREIWPIDQILPGLEQQAMMRWRIEDGGLALEARLALIRRFDTEHGFTAYPASFARAVAYADAGDMTAAQREITTALSEAPDNVWVQGAAATLSAEGA